MKIKIEWENEKGQLFSIAHTIGPKDFEFMKDKLGYSEVECVAGAAQTLYYMMIASISRHKSSGNYSNDKK